MDFVITDSQVARAVFSGVLPSPTQWQASNYVKLRLSGVGVAHRPNVPPRGEYAYRDPAIWLTDEMASRFLGVPIVVEHPASGILSSTTFGNTVVGVVVYARAEGDALWGVGRILDAAAADYIARGVFDTSPAVVFAPDRAGATIDVDGVPLLCEPPPMRIDHVALVYTLDGNKGVWTRQDVIGVKVTP
ncbi:MAG: DUF2213 domain-containing protein [Roseiarcus sp.]|jgi:hypothetical protein